MELLTHLQKGLASVALSSVAFFGVASAASLGFTDDAEIPSWAEEAIEELMDQGVVGGNDDGSFAPNRQLNRAEVSKIIVLATGIDMDTTGGPHFPDVAEEAWFYDYIETMYNQGWINGYPDGMFRPGVGINRAEIAKMVVNGFELDQDLSGAPHFDDVTSGDWFYGYVETIYNNGCMRGYGDGTFGPGNAVTRAETVKIVYDCQLVALGGFNGIAEGTVEVALSNDTPRGTNIPFNATSVPFTTVELTASDDADVEISSMTFTRLGLGDNDDFENVWLEIDGFKVGNDKSVNNDDVVELRFNPPIVVPAGQTIVADVVASMKFSDTDTNTGHHNRFVLVSADDIVSSAANIAGDFPVEGEEMEIASYEVTSMEFDELGSDTTVEVGDAFVEIGKFKMENQSTTNKDVEVRAITFKNDGTAELEDTLENVGLYVSGEQVSAETIIDGDYVTFRLDNGVTGGYIIEDGDSKIFSIRTDIVSAEKGDTINFKVDNFEDVVAVEIGTAFGVRAKSDGDGLQIDPSDSTKTTGTGVTCASGDDAEDDCARLTMYTIDAGDINISRDPSSLSNQEYAPGSNDVVFLTARVVVDQPVIVDGVKVEVNAIANGTTPADNTDLTTLAGLNGAFDNFRLYVNDKLIDTENEFGGTAMGAVPGTAGNAYLDFNTTFELAGTSVIKLVGNVDSSADNADGIKLQIAKTAFDSPEYISTGDQIPADQVLGSAVASFVEVQQSILEIARTDGFSAETIVAGVDDVTFMKFVLDNNDSGDVNVTSISIEANATATSAAENYGEYTAAIFVDGVQQGSSRNLNTSGEATFNDLSVVIPSAGQKEFELVVDTLESLADGTGASDDVAISVTAANADNVENGNEVEVHLAGTSTALGDTIGTDSVDSVTYTFVQSGTLTIADGATIVNSTNIIVANSTEIEVYKIRLSAANDDVEVKDFYFVNASSAPTTVGADPAIQTDNATADDVVDAGGVTFAVGDKIVIEEAGLPTTVATVTAFTAPNATYSAAGTVDYTAAATVSALDSDGGDRFNFKLYDEAGNLIQTKQMTGGQLHFELANADRIQVPKDNSTTVTLKVDARDITEASQTAQRLRVVSDLSEATTGVEAVTASTGSDLTSVVNNTNGSESYVAYRTMLTFANAASQPSFVSTAGEAAIYRFTVSNDAAYEAILEDVTVKVTSSAVDVIANGAETFDLVKYSSSDYSGTPTDLVTGVTATLVAGSVDVAFTGMGDEVDGTNYYEVRIQGGYNNGASDNDSVTGTLVNDATAVSAAGTAGAVGSGDSIVWSDRSNNGGAGQYLNGFELVLPSQSAGISE